MPKSEGSPLPPTTSHIMGTRFNYDFSDVRIHTTPNARLIDALAYTEGHNIHIAPGHYEPHTEHGQQLLAHELAHVVQQGAGAPVIPERTYPDAVSAEAPSNQI